MLRRITRTTVTMMMAAVVLAALTSAASAQNDEQEVTIETVKVTPSVYMLVGRGGNIGVCAGDDGTFVIDDQFADLSKKILAAIAGITDKPVQFLINTHFHGDHTGGNENLAGEGAIIVAHENVRRRLSTEQFSSTFNSTTPPSPEAALPVITFADGLTIHRNGDDIIIFHIEHAHTDGDAIIHFKNNNVYHMGDTLFNGMYPFIDVDAGGSIDGMIVAEQTVLDEANADTKIIPGHGPLAGVDDLKRSLAMLKDVRAAVMKLIEQGKSKDEVIAAKPTAKYDEDWGNGFMKPDMFVGLVYEGLTRAK